MKKHPLFLLSAVILSCAAMALVETVLQPGYLIKSVIKVTVFAGAALLYALIFREDLRSLFRPKALPLALALGAGIYSFLLLAFFLFRSFIDLDAIAAGLLEKERISPQNFLFIALYISIVNSALEELLFRGLAYVTLRRHTGDRFANLFSAAAFAGYHVAILSGWFSWWIYGLCLAGLFIGGLIFNALDAHGSILPSWIAHASANLAINTIGMMMFGLLPG